MNVRFGAGPLLPAGSLSTFDSAKPSPVPDSGDPIEPGGHDQGRTRPPNSNVTIGYSLFTDRFEQPARKK